MSHKILWLLHPTIKGTVEYQLANRIFKVITQKRFPRKVYCLPLDISICLKIEDIGGVHL